MNWLDTYGTPLLPYIDDTSSYLYEAAKRGDEVLFEGQLGALREAGFEYGAATGRPRRVGGFDIPASLYGVRVQGATELALTKLDVLSYLECIPVCVAYEVDGVRTTSFPAAAIAYIRYIEEAVGCPITYVSVGPGRDDYLTRG